MFVLSMLILPVKKQHLETVQYTTSTEAEAWVVMRGLLNLP